MDIPRIFVSSTFKDLQLEREYVKIVCNKLGFDVQIFPERSTGSSHTGDYIKRLRDCHVLIYAATGQSDAVDRELDAARRLGVPTIELAKIDPATGAITTTALGRRSVSPRFQIGFRSLRDLRTALTEALQEIVYRRFESPKRLLSFGPDAYALATRAVDSATFRLGIVQETPTLLLGPDSSKYVEEKPFHDALITALTDVCENKRTLEFLYLFDEQKTREEIANNKKRYSKLDASLNWLRNKRPQLAAANIVIKGVEGALTASVVHDASLEISTVLHDKRYYLWLDEVGGAANDFWVVLEKLSQQGTDVFDFIDSL